MKIKRLLVLTALGFLSACQAPSASRVTIIDGDQVHVVATNGEHTPRALIIQAGVNLGSSDQVLLQGRAVDPQQSLPASATLTVQVRHVVKFTINGKPLETTAGTVGEALAAAGFNLRAADELDPPAESPIIAGMQVSLIPSREFSITVDDRQIAVRSAAHSISGVLGEAGVPLIGLDFSQPAEDQPPPDDGQIRIIRVMEDVLLAQKPLPFESKFEASSQVELDRQQVLEAGQPGLAVSRTRVRYEDGRETNRQTEPEIIVRHPRDRVVGYGTKIAVHTATVDGLQIRYWRAVQMFATAYSPCNSAADRCYPATSSGEPVQKGVVAVKYSWYLSMQGQALYVPGYGHASIEDVCGGCVGKPWIDLGYTDAQYAQEGGQWGRYVTVYFLAPAPASIMYVLE